MKTVNVVAALIPTTIPSSPPSAATATAAGRYHPAAARRWWVAFAGHVKNARPRAAIASRGHAA